MKRASRRLLAVAVLAVVASGVVLPIELGGSSSSAASPSFSIVTNPPLNPPFSPAIQDYAIRCTGSPTTNVATTGSDPVTIGSSALQGPADVNLPLVAGQGLQITDGTSSYHVRCLPSDFPAYSAAVTGTPQQANGYFLTLGHYAVVFDTDGVPVWWYPDADPFSPFDAKFIDPTTIAYSDGQTGTYFLRGIDGGLKTTLGGPSNPLDFHDLQLLPNGNYLGIKDVTRNCPAVPTQCVDLSSWGRSSQSAITDNVIVEVNPANQVVWQWSVADHIDVSTANVNWRDQFPDVIHMNSILYDGNGGIIFSARHLDAVYRIDMSTGAITWKLGGSAIPQSLTVSGDQYSQLFSGQHFARLQADGSLTVHDNGTRAGRQPRALRFTLDTSAGTATEVEQVTDSRTVTATCCGSANKLAGGDWVVSWGFNDFMTELNSQGAPQITITYPGTFSYRVGDVSASVDALRQGMDAMVAPFTDVPTTFVGAPESDTTLSGVAWLDAGATDPVGVTKVEYRLTGGSLQDAAIATAAPTSVGWLAAWDTTTVPNGTYTLQSVAYDAANASADSVPVTVTVANAPIATSVYVPSPGAMLAGLQYLDAGTSGSASATKVEFHLTGGSLQDAVIATAGPTLVGWLAAWDTTTVPNGTYTLQSVAYDAANDVARSQGIALTVDNPSVTAVSPISGPGAGGTKVTITGTGLTGATKVMFGPAQAASYTVKSPTKIIAVAPAETAGTVDVTVTTATGGSFANGGDRYTFLPPSVTKVSPVSGPTTGGTQVAISGTNLAGATQVLFGSVPAASFSVSTNQKVLAIAPSRSAGTVDVTVVTPGGTSGLVAADHFTFR